MQHEVTNDRDSICNMKLPMVGTLYVTRDPICNGTLPTLLENAKLRVRLFRLLITSALHTIWKFFLNNGAVIPNGYSFLA